MACGLIALDQILNCENPLQAGTRENAKVLNLADIATSTRNATTKAIEAFTNTVPGSAAVVGGITNTIKPRFEQVAAGPFKKYMHQVAMLGFDLSPEVKDDLENAKDGQFVVVVENAYKGEDGNAAFEIYGLDNGMELSALTRDPLDDATQGAFDFTFSSELNKEPKMPATLWNTDYATTKAIFDAL
jgi:hypothetical protein